MDENDDALLIEPDALGTLDLTNRAWVNLDHRIWNYSSTLLLLDVSYNNMFELPVNIGELSMLREFRAAFNKLVKLPSTIGKLKRLRKLVLNGNKLKHLPDEIGRLDQLEELILSENRLRYCSVLCFFPYYFSSLLAFLPLLLSSSMLSHTGPFVFVPLSYHCLLAVHLISRLFSPFSSCLSIIWSISYLPSNIRYMSTLTVLKLQNNDLQALPPELSGW